MYFYVTFCSDFADEYYYIVCILNEYGSLDNTILCMPLYTEMVIFICLKSNNYALCETMAKIYVNNHKNVS